MYGSSLTFVTLRPRASRSAPIEAAARPLPIELTTPPVTKMYLVRRAFIAGSSHVRAPEDRARKHGRRLYESTDPNARGHALHSAFTERLHPVEQHSAP